jgi:purine-binding chemotaxis protein CheW
VATLTSTEHFYGILTIGASQVALPLAGLREVIPCPAQLIALPSHAPGLLGAVDLRGQVIPVLDLRVVLRADATRTPQQVIVVIIHEGQLLGLLADEVRGVTITPAAALHAMTAVGDQELLFSHSFERHEDGSVVSVLDIAAICRLPGTPLIRESSDDGTEPPAASGFAGLSGALEPTGGSGVEGAGQSMLLMRCGDIGLGIEIEHVHATLPHLDVRPSPLQHGICLGVVDYGSVQVPVIDPLQLMGMGVLPSDRVQGLVLRFDAGLIILLLTEVIEIVQVRAEELLDLPAFTVRHPEFFRGVVQVGELGDFLVLRSDALMESEQLQTLSTLNMAHEQDPGAAGDSDDWAPSSGTEADGPAGGLYLTYSVVDDVASPLDQVLEILPYPKEFASLGENDGRVLGLLTHRDSVVPLVCLATVMGRPAVPDPAGSCVLLVSVGTGSIGLVVRSLGAIERSVWEERVEDVPERHLYDPLERALADKRTIRTAPVGSVGSERMLPRVDLLAIAEALATAGWHG